jgi:hypothetical protein
MCLGDWTVGPDRQRNRRYSTQPPAAVQGAAVTSGPSANPDGHARQALWPLVASPRWLERRSTSSRPPLSLKLVNYCGG